MRDQMAERDWNDSCHRCGVASYSYTMSFFNTELICPKCDDAEKANPEYKQAVEAERAEVMKGNMNYPGIGLPSDMTIEQVAQHENKLKQMKIQREQGSMRMQ